jgi:hypothetical protein
MLQTEKTTTELEVKYAYLLANTDLMNIVNDKNPNSADAINEQIYKAKATAMATGLFDTFLQVCND